MEKIKEIINKVQKGNLEKKELLKLLYEALNEKNENKVKKVKKVSIWTDGSCNKISKVGAFAGIIKYKEYEKIVKGGEVNTTSNRMEMKSVIKSLESLKERCSVTVYSDSLLITDAFNKHWTEKWIVNGWKNTKKKPIANKELWEEIIELNKHHDITWVKVKAHSGNIDNEKIDKIAIKERKKIENTIQ